MDAATLKLSTPQRIEIQRRGGYGWKGQHLGFNLRYYTCFYGPENRRYAGKTGKKLEREGGQVDINTGNRVGKGQLAGSL